MLAAIILTTLWLTGTIDLWINGISYVAGNIKVFSNTGYTIQEEYSVSIDLGDLESNVGKDLYNDGTHRIYVARVVFSDNRYEVGFRSSGKYSLSGATLVSGVNHFYKGGSFYSEMSAKMVVEYNNKVYNSSNAGLSGLNFKDGDSFGFYLFPHEAYESGEISPNEEEIVNLTVSNLYKNIWIKK